MTTNLRGKTCVVTGAASGIGRALAQALHREGVQLFLADIDEAGVEKVATEIVASGGQAAHTRCDVSSRKDIEALARQSTETMGQVDILINNAGIGGAGLVEELDPEDWRPNIDVNLWSIIYATRAFLPHMTARGTGHFINVGSGAGIVGIPYHIQYVVSKFGVVGLSEALYSELCNSYPDIAVSVICPFFLNTNIIDRSPIRVPMRLVPERHHDEVNSRMDEFKKIFWQKYVAGALPVDKAVAKYIKGIKRKTLYIFDNPQMKVAQLLKGLPGPFYNWVLQSEERRHIRLIRETFIEMGIPVVK